MASGYAEAPAAAPPPDMKSGNTAKPGKEGMGEPKSEITLCVYDSGKLALRIDGGEKVPVPDMDTAITAVRRFAEMEGKGMSENDEAADMRAAAPPQEDEAAFQAGFAG